MLYEYDESKQYMVMTLSQSLRKKYAKFVLTLENKCDISYDVGVFI